MTDRAGGRRPVKPNGRVLVATLALLLGLAVYAALAVNLAEFLPDQGFWQGLFIAVAGVAWVWPAVRLTRWASQRKGE